MGLLRREGVPVGAQGDWHPAATGLRQAVREASRFLDAQNERIEKVAIRWAMERWLHDGARVGSRSGPVGSRRNPQLLDESSPVLGVSVIGVSSLPELEETVSVWRSILDALDLEWEATPVQASDRAWGRQRRAEVQCLADSVRDILGVWADVAWESPPRGFVNRGPEAGGEAEKKAERETEKKETERIRITEALQLPTPAASPGLMSVE
jgi:hypothetical protein